MKPNTYFGPERRSLPRHLVSRCATVCSLTEAFSALTGMTRDVSGSGVAVILDTNVAVGSLVELSFDMPAMVGSNYYPVRCTGMVVRTEEVRDRFHVAVALKEMRFAEPGQHQNCEDTKKSGDDA